MRVTLRTAVGAGGRLVEEAVELAGGTTLAEMLARIPPEQQAALVGPRTLVLVNGRRVNRERWGKWELREGDTVAIVTGLAGG